MMDNSNYINNFESSQLDSILCCPSCKSSLKKFKSILKCEKCNLEYPIKDNIYYFNIQNIEKESKFFKQEISDKLKNINEYKNQTYSQKFDAKLIENYASPLKDKILLDAGCGTGLSTLILLKMGVSIIFVDIIQESLEFIKNLIKINNISGNYLLIVGDITKLPLKRKSIDIIWSGGVLEHFKSLKRPYLEFYRILKNKGDLVFTIPNKFGFQRILSTIKDRLFKSQEDHFETGFIYYQLKNLFPKRFFLKFKIISAGIEQTYYDLLQPVFKFKLPKITFLFYKNICLFLSKLSPPIKLSESWFILYGKKN